MSKKRKTTNINNVKRIRKRKSGKRHASIIAVSKAGIGDFWVCLVVVVIII